MGRGEARGTDVEDHQLNKRMFSFGLFPAGMMQIKAFGWIQSNILFLGRWLLDGKLKLWVGVREVRDELWRFDWTELENLFHATKKHFLSSLSFAFLSKRCAEPYR